MAAIDDATEKMLHDKIQKLGKTYASKMMLLINCYIMTAKLVVNVTKQWRATISVQERKH